MRITEIHEPINGGTLYSGLAVSTRGRRYEWMASRNQTISRAFREDPKEALPDGRTCWFHITAPRALSVAVRKAVRQAATPNRLTA
jgi:hypothetical protein